MCKILLSINPEYVDQIFEGIKRYEYRKVCCKHKVDKIVIYSTAPIMKVVGEASVVETLVGSPDEIWTKTRQNAGIDKKFFETYYCGKNTAIAYKLTNIIKYKKPRDLDSYGIKSAPQSFLYL